jgi:cytochrome c oxidase subunit 3
MAAPTSFAQTHALRHQFATEEQQRHTAEIGMWIFLATEVMFFGGLFLGYTVYRILYPQAWAAGSNLMEFTLGTVNTAVLLCSSFTMALAVYSSAKGLRKSLLLFLFLTMLLGGVFLGIKAVEYYHHYLDHTVPGMQFSVNVPDPARVELFFFFYFAMTGLHAAHMIVGEGLLAVLLWRAYMGRFSPEYYTPVEITGLYWHFVDIVWLFLYPLFYLMARHKL